MSFIPLPPDDESVTSLLTDYEQVLADELPGWAPSDGAVEVAIGVALADEGSTLYALLREDAGDDFRDFGEKVLGVPNDQGTRAASTTTWTARDDTGYTITAGTSLILDAPAGLVALEVVADVTIASGDTEAAGVAVQTVDPGSAPNGQAGAITFDAFPPWVLTVTLDAPLADGADQEDDDTYAARVRAEAALLSRSPILPEDLELIAQQHPEIYRALVIDLYDDDTDESDVPRMASIYPIQEDGSDITGGTATDLADDLATRLRENEIVRIGTPTRTPIDVDITVARRLPVDALVVDADVTAAVTAALSGATWGQPPFAERPRWVQQRVVRRFTIAAAANVPTVSDIVDVVLNSTPDTDVSMVGAAVLPEPGTINVTVVDPA